jgi:hypothetical protein
MRDAAAGKLDGFRSKEAQVDARIAELKRQIENPKKNDDGTTASTKEARAELKEAIEKKAKLIDSQTAIYREDASWMPWKISASERTFENRQQGVDVLLKSGATDNAETQRPVFFWPY